MRDPFDEGRSRAHRVVTEDGLHAQRCGSLDVALEVGFASQSHLNRMFYKTYGITPGNARKQGPREMSK